MLFSYHGNIMKVLIAYLNESVGNDDYNVADVCSSFFNVLLMEDSDLFIAVLLSVFSVLLSIVIIIPCARVWVIFSYV